MLNRFRLRRAPRLPPSAPDHPSDASAIAGGEPSVLVCYGKDVHRLYLMALPLSAVRSYLQPWETVAEEGIGVCTFGLEAPLYRLWAEGQGPGSSAAELVLY